MDYFKPHESFQLQLDVAASLESSNTYEPIIHAGFISSIISTVGSIINIIALIILRKKSGPFAKLLFAIALSDIVFGVGNIIEAKLVVSSDFDCRILFFGENFGFFSSIAWTCCFAHYIFATIKYNTVDLIEKYFNQYILIATSLALGISVVLFFDEDYKIYPPTGTCWAEVEFKNFGWIEFVGFDIPCLCGITYCGMLYFKIIKILNSMGAGVHYEMMLYPLMLAVCFLPWVILDIFTLIADVSPNYWFILISLVMWNSQGSLNTILYCSSGQVKNECKGRCTKKKIDYGEIEAQRADSHKESIYDSLL